MNGSTQQTSLVTPLNERPGWIGAPPAVLTGRDVQVALIDSGWNRDTIETRVAPGIAMIGEGPDYQLRPNGDDHDRIGHGTACGRLILAMAPGCTVVPIRVFGSRLETSPQILEAAIEYAIERSLRVINVSLGTHGFDACARLYRVCARARDAGIIIVAAAVGVSIPSSFDCVLSVGRGHFDNPYEYSYREDHVIECLSMGEAHVLTDGVARIGRGSSFAAPNIAGMVALMLEESPNADLDAVRSLLRRHSTPCPPM